MTAERKYALTRVGPGDYLLPSNDGRTIWRISRYVDRAGWQLRRWHDTLDPSLPVPDLDSDGWDPVGGGRRDGGSFRTRNEAIAATLSQETTTKG